VRIGLERRIDRLNDQTVSWLVARVIQLEDLLVKVSRDYGFDGHGGNWIREEMQEEMK
jgi:hypothetical protein